MWFWLFKSTCESGLLDYNFILLLYLFMLLLLTDGKIPRLLLRVLRVAGRCEGGEERVHGHGDRREAHPRRLLHHAASSYADSWHLHGETDVSTWFKTGARKFVIFVAVCKWNRLFAVPHNVSLNLKNIWHSCRNFVR